jgi:hypothetical protein
MQVKPPFSFDQWVPGGGRAAHPSAKKAIMKTCALCHGKLGLGTRFSNIWNGRWWAHVRLFGFDSLDKCLEAEEIMRADQESKFQRWRAVFN